MKFTFPPVVVSRFESEVLVVVDIYKITTLKCFRTCIFGSRCTQPSLVHSTVNWVPMNQYSLLCSTVSNCSRLTLPKLSGKAFWRSRALKDKWGRGNSRLVVLKFWVSDLLTLQKVITDSKELLFMWGYICQYLLC